MSHSRHFKTIASCFFLLSFELFLLSPTSIGQQVPEEVSSYTEDGEFSSAMTAAGKNEAALRHIATNQWGVGATQAALLTANEIDDDQYRSDTISAIVQGPDDVLGSSRANDGMNGLPNGASSGGITAADFTTLIQLIQNTVDSDSWQANGAGNGTMQAFPTGVYVDGEGVLNRIKKAKNRIIAVSDLKKRDFEVGKVGSKSSLRKVSLTRLERAAHLRAAQGLKPTEEMSCLAGLTHIRYVMVDPDSNEVIIAGPAGGWEMDENGRKVSVVDGQPVLSLDDFVVCLRNAYAEKGKFGCAIVPRKKNLAATKQYVSTSRKRGREFQKGLRDALGQQDIDVFGIPADSRAARVLVEADYHMKLVGMGIEPTIPAVPGYLKRVELDANGNPPPMDVVRWWFTLNYTDMISNESQTLFEFRGPGVKVLAETEFINRDGDRIHTGKAVGPTATFARDFTEHFESLAGVYPIYNELKNVFDLAIVANLIREYDLAESADWDMPYFVADSEMDAAETLRWTPEKHKVAKTVESVMNRHSIRERSNGETTVHTLIAVSGGVSFDAGEFLSRKELKTVTDVEFTKQHSVASKSKPDSTLHWWWD